MAKFISVLDSQVGDPVWTAVQWADTKQELEQNPFYTAGVNLTLQKNAGDVQVDNKIIREIATGTSASVTMIRLSAASAQFIKLAASQAKTAAMKKIQKSLKA